MAKKQCSKGHIFDTSIYGEDCPFCPAQNGSSETGGGNKTVISRINDSGNSGGETQGETQINQSMKTVISGRSASEDSNSGFNGETQIGQGLKTKISGRADLEPVPIPVAMPTCKSCGKELQAKWTSCSFCGAGVIDNKTLASVFETVALMVFVVMIVAVICYIYWH